MGRGSRSDFQFLAALAAVAPFCAHGFKKEISGSELVSIAEAGHMVIVEKTPAVVEAIGRLG